MEGEEVAKQFVKHFQEFLGSEKIVKEIRDPASLFANKIPRSDAENMVR